MRRGLLRLMAADSPALLAEVEQGLLALERGEQVSEAGHSVLRAVHAVRGGAALAGCEPMERLAGGMEAALRLVAGGGLEPRQHLTDALLQAADVLAAMFARLEELEHVETAGALRALEAALGAGLPGQDLARLRPQSLAVPGRPGAAWGISPWLLEHQPPGVCLYCLTLPGGGQVPAQSLYTSLGELLTLGDLLACAQIEDQDLALLYASALEAGPLCDVMSLPRESLRPLGPEELGHGLAALERPQAGPAEEDAPLDAQAMPVRQEATPRAPDAPASREPEAGLPAPVEGPVPQYLVFDLGPETYAVEVGMVREIFTLPPITALPLSPAHVLGVMNLRGAVVPVFDLRRLLGLPHDQSAEPVVVLARLEGKLQGVVVDMVREVVAVPEETMQEAPDMAGPVGREHLRGLVEHDSRLVILVDLAGLLGTEAMRHAS
ncbi:MAG: chemotaxis protein CheW [Desulfarculaceae bacterium]|nr:chemotaxis protein CheW [Desulfarculaceae bacterium]